MQNGIDLLAAERRIDGQADHLAGRLARRRQIRRRRRWQAAVHRKIADQEKMTYDTQKQAEEIRQAFEQAKALANTQARVADAERTVQIAEFTAKAAIATAEGAARSKTINAQADAQVTTVNGDAEAGKIRAIGEADAAVIRLKIESIQSDNYARIEVARALATSGFKLVPEIMAGGTDGKSGGTMVDVLLANMVQSQMNGHNGTATPAAPHHEESDKNK